MTTTPSSSKRKEPMTTPIDAKGKSKAASSPPENHADGDEEFIKVLTREEKRKQRKVDKQRPQFQFDISYFRAGKKIGIAHIRDLILFVVADAQRPGWIMPEHKSMIAHTVVLFVPGLLPEHLGLPPIPIAANLPFSTALLIIPPKETLPPARLPIIPKLFTYGCPTRAPGDQRRLHSCVGTLLQSPLSDGMRRKKEDETRKLAALAKSDATSPLIYLLTPHQMLDNDYRLPSYVTSSETRFIPGLKAGALSEGLAAVLGKVAEADTERAKGEFGIDANPSVTNSLGRSSDGIDGKKSSDDGWIETAEATDTPDGGLYPFLALDCEMVLTADGQELARVSVIDFQSGLNVYDQLVKPSKPVTDYRTKWSGITPEKLSSATHTLSSIQHDLLVSPNPLITPHTILLGHSLECDLTALKIRHSLCIDTAIIYKHPRGPPYKPGLKWLAQRWLGQEIQSGVEGHDSEEDARACVDLLKMKMANGPDFGTFLDNSESIFDRMTRHISPTSKSKTSAYCDYGNTGSGFGAKATTAVKCFDDDGIVERMVELIPKHHFTFGRLMELANVQGWNGNGDRSSSPLPDDPSTPIQPAKPTLEKALSNLNNQISTLHTSLPPNTALILLSGHGNPLPMLELTRKRQNWERMVKTVGGIDHLPKEGRWLAEDDRELEKRVGEAREGMAFFCVKGK